MMGLTAGKIAVIFAFGLGGLALSGLSVSADHAEGDTARGATVYNGTCVACHAENGKGAFPGVPNFTKRKGPLAKSDHELALNIITGFQSPGSMMPMPANGGDPNLSEQNVMDVIAYLRSAFGKK